MENTKFEEIVRKALAEAMFIGEPSYFKISRFGRCECEARHGSNDCILCAFIYREINKEPAYIIEAIKDIDIHILSLSKRINELLAVNGITTILSLCEYCRERLQEISEIAPEDYIDITERLYLFMTYIKYPQESTEHLGATLKYLKQLESDSIGNSKNLFLKKLEQMKSERRVVPKNILRYIARNNMFSKEIDIDVLRIPKGTLGALKYMNINTVQALCICTEYHLQSIPGIGPSSLEKIQTGLELYLLRLVFAKEEAENIVSWLQLVKDSIFKAFQEGKTIQEVAAKFDCEDYFIRDYYAEWEKEPILGRCWNSDEIRELLSRREHLRDEEVSLFKQLYPKASTRELSEFCRKHYYSHEEDYEQIRLFKHFYPKASTRELSEFCLKQGWSVKRISRLLNKAPRTIYQHRSRLQEDEDKKRNAKFTKFKSGSDVPALEQFFNEGLSTESITKLLDKSSFD